MCMCMFVVCSCARACTCVFECLCTYGCLWECVCIRLSLQQLQLRYLVLFVNAFAYLNPSRPPTFSLETPSPTHRAYTTRSLVNEDCFYYYSYRNNVVVLFETLKVQLFVLTEVSDCGLLIVVTSSFVLCFLFLCVRVCVYLRMYVRAYLAISCVSANDNVKQTKTNIRYDNKINKMKKM